MPLSWLNISTLRRSYRGEHSLLGQAEENNSEKDKNQFAGVRGQGAS